MWLSTVSRYWHTLRHLHSSQILALLRQRVWKSSPDLSPPPALRPSTDRWIGCDRPISMPSRNQFLFLNRTETLSFPDAWCASHLPRLWSYHLHYFDDLVADESAQRTHWHKALIRQWIAENKPGSAPGWEPYPTSLRILNWVKFALSGRELGSEAIASLAIQARWLASNLEWHLLANHLLANTKALLFAGAYFQGTEAERWRELGTRILAEQLDEQILTDGGHFERSPMYHAIVLEDLLDILQLVRCYPEFFDRALTEKLQEHCHRMFIWLNAMTHPDGQPAFFNDCCTGQAPTLRALQKYAGAIGFDTASIKPHLLLADSGYVSARKGDAFLLMDVGEVGPDYQPGHAHADTLSVELSLGLHRVFVNSGIDRYEEGAERLWQRGTAAHNTVEIDGLNSSEVWKSFRVARRARPFDLQVDETDSGTNSGLVVQCSHDGYHRLAGRPVHERRLELRDNALVITDTIIGDFKSAVARLYLHPSVSVVTTDSVGAQLAVGDYFIELTCSGAALTVQYSHYFPGFYLSQANKCLTFEFTEPECQVWLGWLHL